LGQDSLNSSLQAAVVIDSSLAFFGHFFAQGLGRSFTGNESGPSVIDAMEFGGLLFAGAIGFTTGAGGCGKAPGQ
jgi:hypothetical protein